DLANVVALRCDDELIPGVFRDPFLEIDLIGYYDGLRRSVRCNPYLLAPLCEAASPTFFVDAAGVVVLRIGVGPLAGEDEISGGDALASILDPRVAARESVLQPQLEVDWLAAPPDQEGVEVERIRGRGLAGDDPVADRPAGRIPLPPGEVP